MNKLKNTGWTITQKLFMWKITIKNRFIPVKPRLRTYIFMSFRSSQPVFFLTILVIWVSTVQRFLSKISAICFAEQPAAYNKNHEWSSTPRMLNHSQCHWKYVDVMRQTGERHQRHFGRSEGCQSPWGLNSDSEIPDLAYETSGRIYVGCGSREDFQVSRKQPALTAYSLERGHNDWRSKKFNGRLGHRKHITASSTP